MSISSGTTAVPSVAERVELGLVEGRVGDGEAALGGEARQLRAAERDLVGHRRLPVAQEIGRRDVVVVHQLGLGARRQDVEDGAPDGRLIQQPAVAAGPAELDDGLALGLHVLGVAAVEDVRVDAGGTQSVPQVQRVDADGVTAGEGRNDLVDPHGRAVYRRALAPRLRLPMHQIPGVAPVALVGSCWSEHSCRALVRRAGASRRRSARSSSRWPWWGPPPCSASPPRRRPTSARRTGHPCRPRSRPRRRTSCRATAPTSGST